MNRGSKMQSRTQSDNLLQCWEIGMAVGVYILHLALNHAMTNWHAKPSFLAHQIQAAGSKRVNGWLLITVWWPACTPFSLIGQHQLRRDFIAAEGERDSQLVNELESSSLHFSERSNSHPCFQWCCIVKAGILLALPNMNWCWTTEYKAFALGNGHVSVLRICYEHTKCCDQSLISLVKGWQGWGMTVFWPWKTRQDR